MQNWSNLHRIKFKSTADGYPLITPEDYEPCDNWVAIKDVLTYKGDKSKAGVHFFNDDYRFERCYTNPKKWIEELSNWKCVLSPDYSMFREFPLPINKYNYFRGNWCGALWQRFGIKVYPTVGWLTSDSYSWVFSAMPVGGCVAVSNKGVLRNKDNRKVFIDGFNEMKKQLKPSTILLFGNKMEEITDTNVIYQTCDVNSSIAEWKMLNNR